MAIRRVLWAIALLVAALAISACSRDSEPELVEEFDWRSDWAVQAGFSLSIDTIGYELPSAIAFVPNPGEGPKDPVYFVTELRKKVKVVTNDRTVQLFAEDFFDYKPRGDFPAREAETGMAGICLDPAHGYVFVTFTYQDETGVTRNNVARFQTAPAVFSIKPISISLFTEVFSGYDSGGGSHQIGPCQVNGDLLYVGIGDGGKPSQSQHPSILLGKIARMTLDGKPSPANPFYVDDDVSKASNFVWASGFRNPFGLKIVDDRVFVADNGRGLDRFIEAIEGKNYLWDGTDRSIGANATAVFGPARGVSQVDYDSGESGIFPPELKRNFILVVTGSSLRATGQVHPIALPPSVLRFEYGFEESRLVEVPKPLVDFQGFGGQGIVAATFGPDALYFVPILPNREGTTAILKIAYDPENEHPFVLGRGADPVTLIRNRGCLGCHTLYGSGGNAGPSLDRDRLVPALKERLTSEEYRQDVLEVDALDRDPFVAWKGARDEILAADGLRQVNLWVRSRIQEPKFDDPDALMPNLEIPLEEASAIADFLVGDAPPELGLVQKASNWLADQLPRPRKRHMAFFGVGGFFAGGAAMAVLYGAFLALRRYLRIRRERA